MAVGAATVLGRYSHDSRPGMMDVLQFAGDNAYPAGGSPNFRAFVRQAVARGSLDIIAVLPLDTAGYGVFYDQATDRLRITAPGGGAEATGDLSGTTFRVLVISC
jgi:hypothetical protein